LNDYPDFRLMNMAVLQELGICKCHHSGGDSKAQALIAARSRKNKSVNSHQIAVRIHQRATAVAWIDGRVRLDIDERTIRIGLARHRAHHAHGHRIAQPFRTPESKHHFALGWQARLADR
jgi:hypothetical protein